jgi:hypothetical protein
MAVNFTAILVVAIIANAAVIYEPSVFNGTGQEIRRNLVLKVNTAVSDQLLALEQANGATCSVVKPDTIRVKVGMNAVKVFDADHKGIETPGRWIHPNVEVRLEVRGTWKTANGTGISVSCTDIRYCSDEIISPFFTAGA